MRLTLLLQRVSGSSASAASLSGLQRPSPAAELQSRSREYAPLLHHHESFTDHFWCYRSEFVTFPVSTGLPDQKTPPSRKRTGRASNAAFRR